MKVVKKWRLNWFKNQRFQGQLLLFFIFIAILNNLLFYGVVRYFFYDFAKTGQDLGINPNHVFFKFLDEQRFIIENFFIWGTLLSFVIIILAGLFISNKVAGPIYRMTKELDKIANLDSHPDELIVRKGDYFQEMFNSLNNLIRKKL